MFSNSCYQNPASFRRLAVGWLLMGSAVPLGLALLSQYGFGLRPCELCTLQRVPYAGVLLMALALLMRPYRPHMLSGALMVAIFFWIIEAGLALYHVGVEESWWQSASGCSAGASAGQTVEELRAAIRGAALVSCSDAAIRFLGLSMAAWNGLAALLFASGGAYLFAKRRKYAAAG